MNEMDCGVARVYYGTPSYNGQVAIYTYKHVCLYICVCVCIYTYIDTHTLSLLEFTVFVCPSRYISRKLIMIAAKRKYKSCLLQEGNRGSIVYFAVACTENRSLAENTNRRTRGTKLGEKTSLTRSRGPRLGRSYYETYLLHGAESFLRS
jgi:hypothetical protein